MIVEVVVFRFGQMGRTDGARRAYLPAAIIIVDCLDLDMGLISL